MFCHCGECPKETPRKETVTFICAKCANLEEGWMDVNLIYGRCDTCKKMSFCHVEERKEEPPWAL